MNEVLQPQNYKYQLNVGDFLKLLLSSDEDFNLIKDEMIINHIEVSGVKRLYGEQIENDFNLLNIFKNESKIHRITLLYNTEVHGDIRIEEIVSDNCNSLCCIESKLKGIYIGTSKLNNVEIKSGIETNRCGNFYFIKSFTDDIIINNSAVGNFHIENSVIGNFTIMESFTGYFSILDKSIMGSFTNESSTIVGIHISDSNTKNFFISFCILNNFILTNSISTNIIFKIIFGMEHLVIRECKLNTIVTYSLNCSFDISASEILLLQSEDCYIPEFRISLSCKFEAYITGGQINLIDFTKTTHSKDTIISFSGTRIYALLMDEFIMLGNLYFRQIKKPATPFKLHKFRNDLPPTVIQIKDIPQFQQLYDVRMGRLNIPGECYNVNCNKLVKEIAQPTIRIAQSSLGKTEFTDCPLAEYNFQYNNSKIIDCFISGGSVPGDNITIIDPVRKGTIKDLEEHKQKASIYNQLKKIFEAQGDMYNASIFQSKWANHQELYLKKIREKENGKTAKYPLFKKIKSCFNANSQDIYILWLNKISNNHGESWLRPLGWLLGSALVFYILYLWLIGNIIPVNNMGWNLVGYYFEFLNPLHKSDFIKYSGEASGWAVSVDFASKLFTAFFLYKFLAAFRKHGKK